MAEEKREKNMFDEGPKAGPKKDAPAEAAPKKEKPVKKPGAKKSKAKLILVIVFVMIVGAGAGAYFMFGKKYISNLLGKKPGVAVAAVAKKEAVGPILQLDPFVFNLTGNQSKYAKVSLGVEVKDVKAMEETKKMIPVIRDRILFIFGSKTPEVLMDVNQRENLKKEVHANLKAIFKNEEELKAVYITDIIIQ